MAAPPSTFQPEATVWQQTQNGSSLPACRFALDFFVDSLTSNSKLSYDRPQSASLTWYQATICPWDPGNHLYPMDNLIQMVAWYQVRQPSGSHGQFLLLSDSCGFVNVGLPLWREDGSLIYNYCWVSPVQSFSGSSFTGYMTIFYCLKFEIASTWRTRSPYLYLPGKGWPNYTPRHWGNWLTSGEICITTDSYSAIFFLGDSHPPGTRDQFASFL
jgi:hypothetical protein